MGSSADSSLATKQSTLQKILTSAVNELGMEATLVAIMTYEGGPLIPQVSRGFTQREVRAILRTLSVEEWKGEEPKGKQKANGVPHPLRFRMITPGSKTLLAFPLTYGGRAYGALILGKKEHATLTKREKSGVERATQVLTEEIKKAGLFGTTMILGRPLVAHEPSPREGKEGQAIPFRTYTNRDIQERVAAVLREANAIIPFERAWVTIYDPIAAALEILGTLGTQKRDLPPGHRLPLDESASGWAVRHRKPRSDHNLASTQGRFQDYRQLYKDRFSSALVLPFFVRGRVAGTLTLASKTPSCYDLKEFDVQRLEPITNKLIELFEDPSTRLSILTSSEALPSPYADQPAALPEPVIRREERREALSEVSSFLATEIREPMGYVRAQLEEITAEAHLDFDSQTRIEASMRDLMRIEALLNEVLDFAKPLALDRRPCRIQDVIDTALSLISTDLRVNRIEVTKNYPTRLAQVRWDEAKMQHAFLSIFKNALEAMSPGGHLRVAVKPLRGKRSEVLITIENDGVPIPQDLVDKVFEPYFTTKRSGTGLGLATVKKIVEEHQGQISIASGPEQGTTVSLRMPIPRPRTPYRGKRLPRKPRRGT